MSCEGVEEICGRDPFWSFQCGLRCVGRVCVGWMFADRVGDFGLLGLLVSDSVFLYDVIRWMWMLVMKIYDC